MQIVSDFVRAFWTVALQMAPWLLFGFLFAGILSAFLSPALVARFLGGQKGWRSILNSVLIAVPLPLCSCGVLPVAAGLRRQGAGRGAVAAFLVATPQTGVDSIAATAGAMGWVFAIARPLCALITGLIGGTLVDRFTHDDESSFSVEADAESGPKKPFWARLPDIFSYAFLTLAGSIARPLLLGLTISALITLFVPDDFFLTGVASSDWVAMPVMLLIGMPMYVCSTASIPVALALLSKGLSPGAALVFLIVGPALNAASLTTLFKILGRTGTLIHLAVVSCGALISGLTLNAINSLYRILPDYTCADGSCHAGHAMGASSFTTFCAVALLGLIAYHTLRPLFQRRAAAACCAGACAPDKGQTAITVGGMTCNHCRQTVLGILKAQSGVESVEEQSGNAFILRGKPDLEILREALDKAGFTLNP